MNSIFSSSSNQFFSLPISIIYYMAKNPSTPKCYQKMVKSCKYFFIRNPILIVHCLFYDSGKWKTCSKKSCTSRHSKTIIFNKASFKIWVIDTVKIYSSNQFDNGFISTIAPKIYKCDNKSFCISNVTIYFDQLLLLASTAEFLCFDKTIITHRNGSSISITDIVKHFTNIVSVTFYDVNGFNITSNTVKELLNLPQFSKIWSFELYKIPERFDIDILYDYIKKNKKTQFYLKFDDSISEAYKNRLETIVDELIAADSNLLIPNITYPGMENKKRKQILNRYMNCF